MRISLVFQPVSIITRKTGAVFSPQIITGRWGGWFVTRAGKAAEAASPYWKGGYSHRVLGQNVMALIEGLEE
jgi:hypothetical protein